MIFLTAIKSALGIVPGWLYAIFLAMALGAAGVERMQATHFKTALTAEKLARITETAQRQQVAIQAEQANRTIETERTRHAAEIAQTVAVEQAKTRAAVDRFAGDNQRLRDQLAAYASGRSQSPGDPAPPADPGERAARLGLLLATCRAEGRSDAAELEDGASQIRGLLAERQALH